jgi:hypothetical protein
MKTLLNARFALMRVTSREDTSNLIQLRDAFLSLLAITAMVPVRPLTKLALNKNLENCGDYAAF